MYKKFSYLLIISFLFIISLNKSYTQEDPPPGCDIYDGYGWGAEILEEFNFNNKSIYYYCNYNNCGGRSYIDSRLSADVKAGTKYDFSGITGNWYGWYYSHAMRIFVDWNKDGKFTGTNELMWTTGFSYVYKNFSGSMTIPSSVQPGKYLMRIVTGEDPYGEAFSSGCGDMSYYSQAVDFRLNVLTGLDAGATDVTNPVSPFAVGPYSVVAKFKNFGTVTLTTVTLNWSVNGVNQTPVIWTGSLAPNGETSVTLGVYNFVYPPNGPFNPFDVRVWTSNLNNTPWDDNPGNNETKKLLTPFLNDAGVIGFFGPPEGFGPGVTQVRARVRNYAPKPLTSVRVQWKIDGVLQTPATITGLNIPNGQFQDVVVGTYNFYNKTPLGPFTVEAWTELPNGVTDEDQTNDKYIGGIGPSLVSGTYTVGGSNPHFNDLTTAISYLNSSGVFGPGPVTFEVRPGTYTGQIVLNNPPANGNPVIIRSSTGKAFDVTIRANATNQDNYIFLVDGFNKLQLQNISVQNPNTNFSLAGTVLKISNSKDVVLNNVILNGVANSPKDNNYTVVQLANSSVDFTNSTIVGGSIGVNLVNTGTTGAVNFNKNNFTNFSWAGIKVDDANIGFNLQISENEFKWESGPVPNYGVWVNGKANIMNNNFTGMSGTGNATEGVIKLENTFGNQSVSMVEGNIINASNINGIRLDNVAVFINRNYINLTQTASNMNSLIFANMANGWIGNNMLIGNNVYGIHIHNNNSLNVLYNSIRLNGNNRSVFHTINGKFEIMRNVIMNYTPGYNYELTGSNTAKMYDNVHYKAGSSLAIIGTKIYANINALKTDGYENNSSEAMVTTKSSNDLHIDLYIPQLLFLKPLYTDINYYGNLIESKDYDLEKRESYYAGADEIFLEIVLNRQSDGFIDCENSTKNQLTVSAQINYGAIMTYQWEKDGLPIQGQTQPVLYFPSLKFNQSGVYRCKIMGPGTTKTVYSKPVAVYVATPTLVTEQPTNQLVNLGGVATLTFDAHVNGKRIADAIRDYEVKVQWYKLVNETQSTPLTDLMPRIAGSKSNYLTINKVTSADFGKYFAEIEGLCGKVKTNVVEINEEILEINFTQQPQSNSLCAGGEIIFNVDATTQSTKEITYNWYKDGVMLKNTPGKYDGVNSKHLIIYNVAKSDAGEYWVVAKLKGTAVEKNSSKAKLTVKTLPEIIVNTSDVTVKTDEQLSLEVLVAEPEEIGLKYQWYKDGKPINGADEPIYLVEKASPTDAGEYWCEITNNCGKVTSNKAKVTVTTGGTTDVTEVNVLGYTLSSANPNPVNSISYVKLYAVNSGNSKITLNGIAGEELAIIYNQYVNTGDNYITIDANKLNLSTGTYFVKVEINGIILVNKLIVVK